MKPVARCEERNRETNSNAEICKETLTKNSFFPAEGAYSQNYVAVDKFTFKVFMLENKIQNQSTFLLWFYLGGNLMESKM